MKTLFGLLFIASLASALQSNPSVEELCKIYRARNAASNYVAAIQDRCKNLTVAILKNGAPKNLRGIDTLPPPSTPSLFRSAQLGQNALGPADVRTVIDLRFDRKEAGHEASPPLSAGEVSYDYQAERAAVMASGRKSLYLPTVPEMEHFVGNYVPRLEGRGKPYFCRLPKDFPDGAKVHWVDDSTKLMAKDDEYSARGISVPLVSNFADCHDLYARYGAPQVRAWLSEVKATAADAAQNFSDTATALMQISAQAKGNVLAHCSSGTDRVGRIAMIIEARVYGVDRGELIRYRGPGSDAKIDLIAVDYLLSQRAGSTPEYRFMFPDLRRPERSFLGVAILY